MKRVGVLILILAIVLCGCSELDEVNPAESNIVAEESDTYVYETGSGEEVPGEKILLEKGEDVPDTEEQSEEEPEISEEENVSVTVYRTKSGKKYHNEGCYHLKSKIETTVEEAKRMGLKPCSVCNPPE